MPYRKSGLKELDFDQNPDEKWERNYDYTIYISDLGRVATPDGHAVPIYLTPKGNPRPTINAYPALGGRAVPRQVATLVAEAFLPPIPLEHRLDNQLVLFHRNLDVLDCTASNLTYLPRSEAQSLYASARRAGSVVDYTDPLPNSYAARMQSLPPALRIEYEIARLTQKAARLAAQQDTTETALALLQNQLTRLRLVVEPEMIKGNIFDALANPESFHTYKPSKSEIAIARIKSTDEDYRDASK